MPSWKEDVADEEGGRSSERLTEMPPREGTEGEKEGQRGEMIGYNARERDVDGNSKACG